MLAADEEPSLSCVPWHSDLKLQGKVTANSRAAGGQSCDEIGVMLPVFKYGI